MAWSNPKGVIPTILSASDLSSKQYHFVTLDSSAKAALSAAGGLVDGVLQDKPDGADKDAAVATSGQSKVMAGDAVTSGDLVASDDLGRAVPVSPGEWAAGRALSDASADEYVTVHLFPYGVQS